MPEHLTLSRLDHPADPAFADLLALYLAAFPPEEQKPPDRLRAMLADPRYHFLVARRGPHFAGLAILFAHPETGLTLLEYLATAPHARRQGIGRAILRQLVAPPGASVLLEVEAVEGTPAQQDARARRLRFYRSVGAREILGLRYAMPTVATSAPPPMRLMLLADDPPPSVPRATVAAWLATLYTEVYSQDPADPRLSRMLNPLPDPVPVA